MTCKPQEAVVAAVARAEAVVGEKRKALKREAKAVLAEMEDALGTTQAELAAAEQAVRPTHAIATTARYQRYALSQCACGCRWSRRRGGRLRRRRRL